MNATELFHGSGVPSGLFFCVCGKVYQVRELAEKCCRPYQCKRCGKECERARLVCDSCLELERKAKESERFRAAEKIESYKWSGWVYCEGLGGEFFSSMDELVDWLEGNVFPDNWPEYAWTCDPVPFVKVDVDDILEQIGESSEAYEDFDPLTLAGIPELKTAIGLFNAANKDVVSYNPNFNRAVLLEKAS